MTPTSNPAPVVDLFCGAGGFSAGLSAAGFEVAWAVDADDAATKTFAANHEVTPVTGDIREIDPAVVTDALAERMGDETTTERPALVVGGPPCPTHSHVGRNRLDGPSSDDERHSLYREFLRFVDHLRPTALLIENVPGMTHSITADGISVIEDIRTRCEAMGYRVSLETLDAADYGAPQHRERVFIIGNRRGLSNPHLEAWRTHREPRDDGERSAKIIDDVGVTASATHVGQGGQQMTLAASGGDVEAVGTDTDPLEADLPMPHRGGSLRPWNTVADALTDLPAAADSDGAVQYALTALTPYQEWIRTEDGTGVTSHAARTVSKRDRTLYALLGNGVGYSIEHLPDSLCPHDTDSFPDKYRKLAPDRPSQTVIAHIAKDGHRFIHPRVPRSLTVREAARLQSFPDSFAFPVAQTSAYRQVGNAVPPLVGRALGTALMETVFKDGY